jgi:hypothetical protein
MNHHQTQMTTGSSFGLAVPDDLLLTHESGSRLPADLFQKEIAGPDPIEGACR